MQNSVMALKGLTMTGRPAITTLFDLVLGSHILTPGYDILLILKSDFLALDAADDNVWSILGDDLVIV
jgi:hypothetical protein